MTYTYSCPDCKWSWTSSSRWYVVLCAGSCWTADHRNVTCDEARTAA